MNKNKETVLVTGANGYVASWLVKKLIEKGHTVHASVRNINDSSKTDHLKSVSKANTNKLKIFEADLLINDSFKAPPILNASSNSYIKPKEVNNPQVSSFGKKCNEQVWSYIWINKRGKNLTASEEKCKIPIKK